MAYVSVDMDKLLSEGGVTQGAVLSRIEWILSRSSFRRIRRDGIIKREFIGPLLRAIEDAAVLPAVLDNRHLTKRGTIKGRVSVNELIASSKGHDAERVQRSLAFVGKMLDTSTELGRLTAMESERVNALL